MTSTARPATPAPRRPMLLAIGLIAVTVWPLFLFAINPGNVRANQPGRGRAAEQSGFTIRVGPGDAKRPRKRLTRADIHPTVVSAAITLGFQIVLLILLGSVGRRLFALRL